MREILFRGKRTDNGEWVEGYYVSLIGIHYIYTGELRNGGLYVVAERFEVIPETVGEYTGLTDKSDNRIFEGDILKGNSEYFTYTHPYGKVVYDGGQFLIAFDDVLEDIECLGAWANDTEIIGNIHEKNNINEL